nr:hypothetical protein P5652_05975 [Bacillus subtilis]
MFNELKSDVQKLQGRFASMEQPAPIPMLPESLSTREFSLRFKLERKPLSVPIGLHEETVSPVYFDLGKHKHCLILSTRLSAGKQTS